VDLHAGRPQLLVRSPRRDLRRPLDRAAAPGARRRHAEPRRKITTTKLSKGKERPMIKTWLRRTAAMTALGLAMTAGTGTQAQEQVTLNWALWDWTATAYYQPL